jgi:hypothetical protein
MSRLATAFLVTLALSVAAFGQTATGTIQGRVVDSSGAAVPEATVLIENQKTGVRQSTVSNSSGQFFQPYLIPGAYRVTVEKAGFDKHVTSDLMLSVQQTVALEVPLKVGEVSTTVEVAAAVAQLDTSTSAVSTVVTNKAMLDLPLNGRNPFGLANLVPGVIPGGGSTPWLAGGRNASSEITIDGTSIIVPENNVSIQDTGYQPIVDTVEEVAVITNSVAAEFGRSGGGVITVATRSGTNSLHGSLFDYLRNSKLEANSWNNRRNGQQLAAFQRNQFGGTLGGPVWIPKLYDGRNRTFFFVAEQSTRTRNAASAGATLPIQAWREGNFSDLRNGSGQPITIYDQATMACTANCGTPNAQNTRQPFPGNILPASRLDPVALKLVSYYPQPNIPAQNAFTNQNNYLVSGKTPSLDNRIDTRIDHNFTSNFKMWGRASASDYESTPFNGFDNVGSSAGGSGFGYGANYNVALNTVYTLNPTTILNVSYGLARKVAKSDPISQGFDQRTLGLPESVHQAAAEQNLEFPRFDIGGNNGVASLGQSNWTTLRIQGYGHDLHGDMTKVLAKHTVKFGVNYRKLFMNFRQHGQPSGQYNFGNIWTQRQAGAANSTTQGMGLASFLLGYVEGGTIQHTFPIATASSYWGLYLQDDFKVTPKLTLNMGLRWDVDIPRTERYNRLSYWDITERSPIDGKVPGLPGRELFGAMKFVNDQNRRQTATDTNNWGPRFGFAYQLNNKTVFRGAYAILYSPSVLQASGTSGSSGTDGFQSSTGVSRSFDGDITTNATLRNPFPQGFNLPQGPAGGPATQLGLGIGDTFFLDNANPIIQEWSATLQRDMGLGFVVELGYLANKGNHLIDGESSMSHNQLPTSYWALGNALLGQNQVPNPFFGVEGINPTSSLARETVAYSQLLRPFPHYTSVSAFRKPQGNSIYHAFTLSVNKRYSHGLNLQASYTAGKLLDDVSQTVTFLGAAGTKQDFYCRPCERAISAQDVSQRLVIFANYELPFGKGRKFMTDAPAALDMALGGWQVNGILTLQTALPIAISNGGNNSQLGSTGQRPNNNGKSAKKTGPIEDRLNSYFDQSVFSQAGNFTFGNTSRFSPDLRGPRDNNLDLSLFKRFRIRESMFTEFRAEAFNAFNHPIWNGPGTTVTQPGTFGIVQQKGGQRRVMQLALRLQF